MGNGNVKKDVGTLYKATIEGKSFDAMICKDYLKLGKSTRLPYKEFMSFSKTESLDGNVMVFEIGVNNVTYLVGLPMENEEKFGNEIVAHLKGEELPGSDEEKKEKEEVGENGKKKPSNEVEDTDKVEEVVKITGTGTQEEDVKTTEVIEIEEPVKRMGTGTQSRGQISGKKPQSRKGTGSSPESKPQSGRRSRKATGTKTGSRPVSQKDEDVIEEDDLESRIAMSNNEIGIEQLAELYGHKEKPGTVSSQSRGISRGSARSRQTTGKIDVSIPKLSEKRPDAIKKISKTDRMTETEINSDLDIGIIRCTVSQDEVYKISYEYPLTISTSVKKITSVIPYKIIFHSVDNVDPVMLSIFKYMPEKKTAEQCFRERCWTVEHDGGKIVDLTNEDIEFPNLNGKYQAIQYSFDLKFNFSVRHVIAVSLVWNNLDVFMQRVFEKPDDTLNRTFFKIMSTMKLEQL